MTHDPITVRDALLPDPRVVDANAPAREAAELLVRPGVESVLVVRDGALVGAVTAREIVGAVAAGVELGAVVVGALATGEVDTIGPDAPLDEAIRAMAERDLDRLAVVEGDRLVGVLSREGLVRRVAEDEPPEPDESV
jgi:CBS domain-containing protein